MSKEEIEMNNNEEVLDIQDTQDIDMEARIRLLLELYPVISPTMLQAGLGPQISSAKWRPTLEKLLDSGEVRQESVYRQSVAGRHRNYVRLGLTANMDAIATGN